MPKIKNQDSFDEFSSRRPLTHEELVSVLMDIRHAGGKTFYSQFIRFLEKIGIVSQVEFRETGTIKHYAVIQTDSFKGKEIIPGTKIFYESEIPFSDWTHIRDQIESYLYRREQAEKKDKANQLNLDGHPK